MFSPITRENIRIIPADRFVHVQHARLQNLLAAEGQQLPGERSGAVGCLFHLLDAEPQRRRIRHAVEQELRVAFDDHQQIVEVVRHASGELADGLHLLRLAQLIGEALAFGNVQRNSDHALNRALAVAQRLHVRFESAVFPVHLVGDGVALQRLPVRRNWGGVGILGEKEIEQSAGRRVRGRAAPGRPSPRPWRR